MLVFKSYVKKPQATHMLLVGTSGVGKTTACASYLREATMLLYVNKLEPHSTTYMANGVSLFPGATTDNLVAVAVDLVEELDKEVLPFTVKMNVGDQLNPDQSWAKMRAYLGLSAENGFKTVVIDSLSGFFSTLRGTAAFANACKNDKGVHNSFREAEAYLNMHEELNTILVDLQRKGVSTVSILGAKNINVGSESTAIQPDLPMFSVAEKLPFRYSDVLILSTRDIEGAEAYRTIVDFGLSMDKASKNTTGKVEKFVSIKPRLSFMPPNLGVAWLPPDLHRLRDFIQEIINAQVSE